MHHIPKPRWGTALLPAVLAFCAGCTPPPPRDTHDADVRSISEGELLWVRHWSSRDVERIVARYAEDATLLTPNLPPAIGREAVREVVRQFVRDGYFALTFEVTHVEVARSGDLGYVEGNYTLVTTNLSTTQPFTDQGTYLRVYRKQPDGAWKVLRDIRASHLPATGR